MIFTQKLKILAVQKEFHGFGNRKILYYFAMIHCVKNDLSKKDNPTENCGVISKSNNLSDVIFY